MTYWGTKHRTTLYQTILWVFTHSKTDVPWHTFSCHFIPHLTHLLHMQEEVNLLSLKLLGESKCPGYLNFLWNYSHRSITVMWDDAQVSEHWAIDVRKGEGGLSSPCFPFHYPIFLLPSLTRKLHFLDNISCIFLVKWTGWGIIQDKLSKQFYYIVYTRTIYMWILKFFKREGECC